MSPLIDPFDSPYRNPLDPVIAELQAINSQLQAVKERLDMHGEALDVLLSVIGRLFGKRGES